jgi:hypothetical protein
MGTDSDITSLGQILVHHYSSVTAVRPPAACRGP